MKIKEILAQHRRDFSAILVCENCGKQEKLTSGYDDDYYHQKVIPAMTCNYCGQAAPKDYKPRTPKYPEGVQV